MSFETATLLIFAMAFGFIAGAYFTLRRREEWLKQNQPLDSAWGSPEVYDVELS